MILWTCLNDSGDKSGNGFNGTDTDISWVAGKVGNAASFNGTTSKIDIANPGNVLDGKLLTVAFWLNIGSGGAADYRNVVDRVYNGQFACNIAYVSSAWVMRFAVKGVSGSGINNIPNTGLPTGEWVHVAYVYDGSVVMGYVNGVYKGSLTLAYGVLYASTAAARLGQRHDGLNKFGGLLNDVRIADEVVPVEEILAIVNFGKGTAELEPWQRTIQRTNKPVLIGV
jgi:hypothetical protein